MTAYPSLESIADIVLSLHKLSNDDSDGLVAGYYELAGASWVVAYARDVLGLSVCAFGERTSTVPISGDFRSAKVILRTYSRKQGCELQRVGNIEDFVQVSPLATMERAGWIIDAGSTNYVHFKKDDSLVKHVLATLAGSMTTSCMYHLAKSLFPDRVFATPLYLKTFSFYHLSILRKRALSIMRLLGFDRPSTTTENIWKKYLCYHYRDHLFEIARTSLPRTTYQLSKCGDETIPHLAPTKAWLDSLGTGLTEPCKVYAQFPQLPLKDHLDFNSEGKEVIDCLIKQ